MKPNIDVDFDYSVPASDVMVKQFSSVKTFFSEVPVRVKLADKKYGEFAEWYRHRYEYEVEFPLQGYSRRAEVIKTSPLIKQTPIECSIIDTAGKTMELALKACYYWRCRRFNIEYSKPGVSNFSMLINGIVNAAVNGGTKLLMETFLLSDLTQDPNVSKFSEQLKTAFADQIKTVKFAIDVHFDVVSETYIPLHQSIIVSFKTMKKEMKVCLGDVDCSAAPSFGPLPDATFIITQHSESDDEDENSS